LGPILVAIETDARFAGYGVEGDREAAFHIMGTVLRDRLLGRDIEPVEEHCQAMYRATLPFGRKGVAIMELSGIDLARWDLRRKAAGRSVTQFLRRGSRWHKAPSPRPPDEPQPWYNRPHDRRTPPAVRQVAADLLPLVYGELRRLAAARLAAEAPKQMPGDERPQCRPAASNR
jgi:hypothetical protein